VLPDLHVLLRVFRRASPPARLAECDRWL
jgi:hypothetical protein